MVGKTTGLVGERELWLLNEAQKILRARKEEDYQREKHWEEDSGIDYD